MLATRFIIALCPATPIYLTNLRMESPWTNTAYRLSRLLWDTSSDSFRLSRLYSTSSVKAEATCFDTFEAAMEVAKDVTGWGGAQRVEQVAVEIEDTRVTLDTPEARIEVRDAATCAWCECADCDPVTVRVRHTEDYLRSIGLKVGSDVRAGASCPASLYLADHLGNTAQFDWDPMQDGFDITEATCLAENDPRA